MMACCTVYSIIFKEGCIYRKSFVQKLHVRNHRVRHGGDARKLIHVQVVVQGGRRTPEVLRDMIPAIHAVVAVGEELGVQVRPCWGC